LSDLIQLTVLSYFIGSIPTAYAAGMLKSGRDIRKQGTKNMGTSNALIILGPIFAILIYIIDVLKGTVPVLLAKSYIGTDLSMGLCGLAAIIGHDYPIYVGFKGGKGVATTTGVMYGINTIIMLLILPCWVFFVLALNNFIAASLLSMLLIPIFMTEFGLSTTFVYFGLSFVLLGLFTHRKDIVTITEGKGLKAREAIKKYLKKKLKV
jgi:acyl phosphate:glycerol-3-phosphate acyltransferase